MKPTRSSSIAGLAGLPSTPSGAPTTGRSRSGGGFPTLAGRCERDHIDWLAIDLYSARNPADVLEQFLGFYGKTKKPIMLPECGTADEQTRWNNAFKGNEAWTRELFDVIDATPQIKAVCWFEWDNYHLRRDPAQLKEFRKRIAGEQFVGKFQAPAK